MFVTVVENTLPFNSYDLHEYVWSYFGDGERDFLYRWEGDKVRILSPRRINKSSKVVDLRGVQKFSSLVSIQRGTYRDDSGRRRRYPPYQKNSEFFEWGMRTFGRAGNISGLSFQRFPSRTIENKKTKNKMRFNQFLFSGEIEITNPKEILKGFGAGRAFGYGLMVLEGRDGEHKN